MTIDGMNRRRFLALAGSVVAGAAVPAWGIPVPPPRHQPDFTFLFLTDTHLEPELDGVHGVDLAMRAGSRVPADFAIQGGDHIMDALGVPKATALGNFDLYAKSEQQLGMKLHHTLGNHDVCGIYPASGMAPNDPLYGKKLFEDRFGPTYYTFDHKGVHFVVLDSIGITDDHHYEARIDAAQLDWLKQDLAAVGPRNPVIVVSHIPLVTAVPSYIAPGGKGFGQEVFHGGPAVIELLSGYNVLGVLQGHTHVNETVMWRGVPYLTGGAVCGNWWHGARMGTPEGFTVVKVAGGKLTTEYRATGFRTVAPERS